MPAALRDRYRVIEAFPATGSEADILLVVDVQSGEKAVAKLYRKGIKPDFHLLDILAESVGDTVVRVLDHGVSDGSAFELLEYVPGGTLEELMRAGPLPKSEIRRIVKEIADALAGIHAHRILHRDLKPENVLVRKASPLTLALTDFGIASMSAATQHFTTAARTTKYAAPEVLTGVLDAKSDWWSLGMIVLEAASGRHPFDGLTEQVMNHQLATRPIDVRGVYDDELRLLCRGLLLRDPKRRFGADEVARWLEGDTSLAVAADAEGAASAVRPYRFGKTEATTGAELALALAKHWDAARRDMQRGQIARWLEQELHDYNLLRTLRDIQEQKGVTDDGRLLRFLLGRRAGSSAGVAGDGGHASTRSSRRRVPPPMPTTRRATGSNLSCATTCSRALPIPATRRCAISIGAGAKAGRRSSSHGRARSVPKSASEKSLATSVAGRLRSATTISPLRRPDGSPCRRNVSSTARSSSRSRTPRTWKRCAAK